MSPSTRRCSSRAALALLALATALPAAAQAGRSAPQLTLARRAGLTRIGVELVRTDGTRATALLRETRARVLPGRAGWDPAGRAAFVDWSEGGRHFFAYTRDGGRSWSPPASSSQLLHLHDGRTGPSQAMPEPAAGLEAGGDGRLFLVQLRTHSLPEWRAALSERGAEVLAYFPLEAHVVRLAPGDVRGLRELSFVQRVEPYHPSYRLERGLRDWLTRTARGPAEQRVRVQAFEWGVKGRERLALAARQAGADVLANPDGGHLLEVQVDRGQLALLAAHDDAQWVDLWSPPGEDMDLVRQDSGAVLLENNYGYCGQGVSGEVMDGGIERTHWDFDGVTLHTAASSASHGTSTYGIVFGNGNRDGDGNAQALGHLPCGRGIFASYSGLTDRFTHTQQLKQAPYFASFQSNSWGDAQTTAYTSVSHQMDDIIWRLDFAILNSQSNTGNQSSRPQAWAKNIISVGGIRHANTLSEADDSWSNGASIGPAADGRLKPDIHYWYDSIFTTTYSSATPNSYTTSFGGTSAATPESAGVLGLMLQMWSENVWGTNPTGSTVFERQPHASTMKALLINNAKQYPFSGTTHDLTRTHQGWGRPGLGLARDRAPRSFIVDQGTPLALNETANYTLTVAPGEGELKVTMTYPDPPGTTSATLHRINDLSLKVTSPGGAVYHGNNGLAAGNYSTSGGTPNTIDTVENVFVNSPEAGNWNVEVRAAEINQDAYPTTPAADAVFSLVATGATRAAAPAPDFTLSAAPAALSLRRSGRRGDSTLTVSSVGAMSQPVALTLSGLPAGVVAWLSAGALTPPAGGSASGTASFHATAAAAPGNYNVTITGQAGSTTRSTTVNLTVMP